MFNSTSPFTTSPRRGTLPAAPQTDSRPDQAGREQGCSRECHCPDTRPQSVHKTHPRQVSNTTQCFLKIASTLKRPQKENKKEKKVMEMTKEKRYRYLPKSEDPKGTPHKGGDSWRQAWKAEGSVTYINVWWATGVPLFLQFWVRSLSDFLFFILFENYLMYMKCPVLGYSGKPAGHLCDWRDVYYQPEPTLAVIWNSSCSFSSSWVCCMLEPVEVCVER